MGPARQRSPSSRTTTDEPGDQARARGGNDTTKFNLLKDRPKGSTLLHRRSQRASEIDVVRLALNT